MNLIWSLRKKRKSNQTRHIKPSITHNLHYTNTSYKPRSRRMESGSTKRTTCLIIQPFIDTFWMVDVHTSWNGLYPIIFFKQPQTYRALVFSKCSCCFWTSMQCAMKENGQAIDGSLVKPLILRRNSSCSCTSDASWKLAILTNKMEENDGDEDDDWQDENADDD